MDVQFAYTISLNNDKTHTEIFNNHRLLAFDSQQLPKFTNAPETKSENITTKYLLYIPYFCSSIRKPAGQFLLIFYPPSTNDTKVLPIHHSSPQKSNMSTPWRIGISKQTNSFFNYWCWCIGKKNDIDKFWITFCLFVEVKHWVFSCLWSTIFIFKWVAIFPTPPPFFHKDLIVLPLSIM